MSLPLLEWEGDSHGNWSLSSGPQSSCFLNPSGQPQVPMLLGRERGGVPPFLPARFADLEIAQETGSPGCLPSCLNAPVCRTRTTVAALPVITRNFLS